MIIAISQGIIAELESNGINNYRYIPNGVDINKYCFVSKADKQLLRNNLKLPLNRKIIIFSGRLVQRKGVDILLQSLEIILNKDQNPLLVVAGSGYLQFDSVEKKVKDYVLDKGLSNSVLFLGNIDNIDEYLKVSDVFAFPSRREGMPNAVLEAMATGLPIVATRISGVVDLITDGENGLLVNPEDPKDLAEKLIMVLANPVL